MQVTQSAAECPLDVFTIPVSTSQTFSLFQLRPIPTSAICHLLIPPPHVLSPRGHPALPQSPCPPSDPIAERCGPKIR
ncbi:hypothetical protein CY34DRAFT_178364 [Suillus luteus UH-Slu-Lm8-n1]|uniref:Uncharacterized protein n=1 Tax=Suillus luteus UH-Slu-Lm8-n1 TaxID=930992 RepID=A0A0D0B659_9AGAM|nr:hypothetical protein CY34DRAFT_178364 [Suillus luteus UH-Slu-Lm8-n1]